MAKVLQVERLENNQYWDVKLNEKTYLYIGDLNERVLPVDGPITSWKDYGNFDPGFAHLFEDGRILRHGVQIGVREDLKLIGPSKEIE